MNTLKKNKVNYDKVVGEKFKAEFLKTLEDNN